MDYREFLMGENRYVSLTKKDPALAEKLFTASALEAKQRRNTLKQIVAAQQTSAPTPTATPEQK
jgi:hypothetical protein